MANFKGPWKSFEIPNLQGYILHETEIATSKLRPLPLPPQHTFMIQIKKKELQVKEKIVQVTGFFG